MGGLIIAYFYSHFLNRLAHLSSGARGLKFGLSFHQQPNFLCASREDWREYTFVHSSEPLLLSYAESNKISFICHQLANLINLLLTLSLLAATFVLC